MHFTLRNVRGSGGKERAEKLLPLTANATSKMIVALQKASRDRAEDCRPVRANAAHCAAQLRDAAPGTAGPAAADLRA